MQDSPSHFEIPVPASTRLGNVRTPLRKTVPGGSSLTRAQIAALCAPAPVLRCAVSLCDLPKHFEDWTRDCEIRQLSSRTLEARRGIASKLIWFLGREGLASCGSAEVRRFFGYLTTGHGEDGGRWGREVTHRSQVTRAPRSATVMTYHAHLRAFFKWLVTEGLIDRSPMETHAPPIVRQDQVQPFDAAQITALLAAASKSTYPDRDEAIILFLLDTGVRADELCQLRRGDLDLGARRAVVTGKGNKRRQVSYGQRTSKAIWRYLRLLPDDPSCPVFYSERGHGGEMSLTVNGLYQLLQRLGTIAGIERARRGPHTFRHTFAVSFLRAGGGEFTLQQILGHTSAAMTRRYVQFAQADIERQQRMFSPADRL